MKNDIIKRFYAFLVFSALIFQLFFPPFAIARAEDASSTPALESASTTIETAPSATPESTSTEPIAPHASSTPLATSTDSTALSTSSPLSATSTATNATSTPATATSTATSATATTTLESNSTSTPATTTFSASHSSSEATGTPTIISGEAVATANILNLVNTNFINSNGVILFSNFFDLLNRNLDLRNSSLFDGACSQNNCSGSNAIFNLSNNSFIQNLLSVFAQSGNNTIDGGATSTINSGDAYAGLNLVNVANTNFVDSEYLLVTLNAFKGVDGDIVFPSLTDFFDNLKQSSGSISLNNNAEVQNNVGVGAESGSNKVDGPGTISTGSSTASSNVFNQLNTNLVGGANVSILFRVYGNWVGDIFGAPDNLKWIQNSDGSLYLFDTGSSSSTNSGLSTTTVSGNNNAIIHNNVSVIALTGQNSITGAGTGLISTGNAVSGANIVNIANSNIIGRNWIMAIVNIFGDWHGNIAFGRPDLWVGEQISAPSTIHQNDILDYKLTVINNGDSPATQVKLTDNNAKNMQIMSSSLPYSQDENGDMVWQIGSLPAGKATEITYRAKVLLDKEMDITNTIKALARETDNNAADNTDTASVHIRANAVLRPGGHRHSSSGSVGQVLGTSTSFFASSTAHTLSVQRADPLTILKDRSQSVHQKLVVSNPTDQVAKNVIFRDTLRNPEGKLVHTEAWDFGDVQPHESIVVTYDLEFNPAAKNGFYNLASTLESASSTSLNTGINGLVLLGDFRSPSDVAKKKTATSTIAVVHKQVERPAIVQETPKPQVIPIELGTSLAPDKPEQASKYHGRLYPIVAVFSSIPDTFNRLFQAVRGAL